MTAVAMLGAGAMGSRMALNLLKGGHPVSVWNRDARKLEPLAAAGAKVAPTPAAAAQAADIVVAMVRDDDASRSVWLAPSTGALHAMAKSAVAVEVSTLTLNWVKELAATCEARGIGFLDAPVSGSRLQADARQLVFMVGGSANSLERAEPVLKSLGSAVHHAGPAGSGAALKLAVNTLFAAQVATLAEQVGVLEAHGIDLKVAAEIIGATPVASPAAKGALQSMLSGSFAPMFPVQLVEKDLAYAEEAAAKAGFTPPIVQAARLVFQRAINAGFGADNLTGVVRLYGDKP
jgi:3-hydroxyisobutyrate dehydrogenase